MSAGTTSTKEIIRKLFLIGMGAVSLTREKAEKLAEELVEKGEVSSEDAKGFIRELMDKGRRERDSLKEIIKEELSEIREEFGLATLEQLKQLELRIQELEERINSIVE